MSDPLIISLLAAGCFVLWLFLHRRNRVATNTTPAPKREPRPLHLKCETVSTFSPAYHNKKGWPAAAIEMLPPIGGNAEVEDITFTEHVIATYGRTDIDETLTVEETIDGGPDIELVGLQDEVTEHSPHPRCKVVLAVNKSVLERTKAPDGFDPTPTCITVMIGMELTGRAA